jgi:hypothetical protein
MPEAVVNSEATEDEYKRLREMRRRALKMIPGHWEEESEAVSQRMESGKRAVVRQVRRIRVKRIGKKGEEVEQDLELGSDSEGCTCCSLARRRRSGGKTFGSERASISEGSSRVLQHLWSRRSRDHRQAA